MIAQTDVLAAAWVIAGLVIAAAVSCRPALDDSRPSVEMRPVVSALEGAGLRVERIGSAGSEGERYLPSAVQLSVDGYDKVWLYRYGDGLSREQLAEEFDLHADFMKDSYPVLFVLDRTVVLVRGTDSEAARNVYTALWVLRPPHQIALFSGPLAGPSALHRCQAVDVALIELHWYGDMRPGCNAPEAGHAAVVRFGDYLKRFRLDEKPHRRLPHPDTPVWVVMDHPSRNGQLDGRWDVVAVDWWSGIVIGIDRDVQSSRFASLPVLPMPGPLVIDALDGSQSSYDELATVTSWGIPSPAEWPDTGETEEISVFVIERALARKLASPEGSDTWRTLSVVRANDGWLIGRDRPRRLRQIEFASNRITYRDWEVVEGERYAYRIYGCTPYGRRTTYSNVAEAVAGDPDPSTYTSFGAPSENTLFGCPRPD